MGNFSVIQQKLHQFIRKYYSNELIKGLILFAALGLLYLFFTLFIEYILWLSPRSRTVLFYAFIAVELLLLIKFIFIPILRLFGLKSGISQDEASKIIGRHFPEVNDKLLNLLQLNHNKEQTELLLAGIEQKAAGLKIIPFKKAIDFRSNIKYLKYLAIPVFIWLVTWISGRLSIFNESLNRVVHYQQIYEPPAPFTFSILNDSLKIIEGKSFNLKVQTHGEVTPENVSIHFNNENYILKNTSSGNFEYNFDNCKEPVSFYLEANGITSHDFLLDVVPVPTITGFEMLLDYPGYTGKNDETIRNTGNTVVPEGTRITWNIVSRQTDSLSFLSAGSQRAFFERETANNFTFKKQLKDNLNYQIITSNRQLKNYEALAYTIDVIKDTYPRIDVRSDIDSVSRGPVQFAGQLSDDYGLTKLNLIYYNSEDANAAKNTVPITINNTTFEQFYYIFYPDNLTNIEPGKTYTLYFEVSDNDGVNGNKSTRSHEFTYYNKTAQEITDDLLKEQKQNLEDLNSTTKEAEELSKDIEEFSKSLKNKPDVNWNDKKELDAFLKRQEQYQEMFRKQTDNLLENIDEQELNNPDKSISEKQDELKKRIEEAKDLQEKNQLLEELKKMADKLEKEEMLQKLDQLTEKNRQERRTLERMLELTKRFFVEKKLTQIVQKTDTLAAKQEKLSESKENNAGKQEELNKQFEDIQKDFKDLQEQNNELIEPMDFPDTKSERNSIEETMQEAREKLEEKRTKENPNDKTGEKAEQAKQSAISKQRSAAQKMKQLSQKLSAAQSAMQGEMLNENIENIRAILENLLAFSFGQEQLMLSFEGIDAGNGDFPKKLKEQFVLKEDFEHIDDSLYTLSLRVQKLSSKIQTHLTDAHYNLDKSLENLAENRINQGMSNQRYTMTAANDLADMLSDLLNSLLNPSSGQGSGNQFNLPDIIEKQQGLKKQLEKGMQQGEQQGQGQSEQMSAEQYQIYQQQAELRRALEELLDKEGNSGAQGKKALKQMEELEKQLLDKGLKEEVMQNMLRLEHELLKLKDATLQQGEDSKRNSDTNKEQFLNKPIAPLKNNKLFFNT
ncbi:MAG: hypothetical protein KDC69_07860, partial [Flavobacteriaceae bacterium]|nr:hypothetical protein [Flavobacteriaceae bacterium]